MQLVQRDFFTNHEFVTEQKIKISTQKYTVSIEKQ